MQGTPKAATARTGAIELDYELRGTGDPLVLISGTNDTRSGWDLVVPALEDSFSCLLFDNRDVGASPRVDDDYAVVDMVADTIAVLDRAGIDSAHLVGHSLGSVIAQHLCFMAPERARSLTLIGSWARTDGYLRAMVGMWRRWATVLDDETLAASCALFWFGESTIERVGMDELVPELVDMMRAQGRDAFRRQLGAALDHDTLDRLGGIAVPTLVIWGEEDRTISGRHARELMSHIPDATLVCVPGAGHSPTVETPEAVEAALEAFLRRH